MSKKIYKYRKFNEDIPLTGLESLDKHHSNFVMLINCLVDILNKKDEENKILTIFHKLLYYAEIFFIEEELYYQKNNFSDLNNHKAKHREFVKSISSFREEYQSGSKEVCEKMMKFLDRWYKNHLLKEDIEAVKIIDS